VLLRCRGCEAVSRRLGYCFSQPTILNKPLFTRLKGSANNDNLICGILGSLKVPADFGNESGSGPFWPFAIGELLAEGMP
jgi:hypothetical protein